MNFNVTPDNGALKLERLKAEELFWHVAAYKACELYLLDASSANTVLTQSERDDLTRKYIDEIKEKGLYEHELDKIMRAPHNANHFPFTLKRKQVQVNANLG